MSEKTSTSRTGSDKPAETSHLSEAQKKALDSQADAEHEDGPKREELTRQATQLGDRSAA